MEGKIKKLLFAFVITGIFACGGRQSKQPATIPVPAFVYLDEKITSWINSGYYDDGAVRIVKDGSPVFGFCYGGLAMQVAGRMAEIATGKDWETLFQEKIARPLQMEHSQMFFSFYESAMLHRNEN
jgi:CubicO group peptidase (beta-lactamase class C family)